MTHMAVPSNAIKAATSLPQRASTGKRFGARDLPIFLLVALVVLVLDQVSKVLIINRLGPDEGTAAIRVVGDWLRLVYVTNTGSAFGLFPDRSLLFMIIAVLAIPFLLFVYRQVGEYGWPSRVSIGLLLGGTLGNLVDRVRLGYVVDFVDAGVNDLRWFTFNVADSSFVIGVLVLCVFMLLSTPGGEGERRT